ncbi:MAG: hypothetical protein PHW96_02245 [Candidatus Nanoarchaeia archaeon]|nr:hypothetical protein [Candidatus Nanoarchaeia archaeon]
MRKILPFFILTSAILVAGCTSENINSVIKALPQVKDFLSQYSDADFSVVYWNAEYTQNHLSEILELCGKTIDVKDYYYAVISGENTSMKLWVDKDTYDIACLIKETSKENNTLLECIEYCESQPHVQCVGSWNISGAYPDCICEYICDTEEPEPVTDIPIIETPVGNTTSAQNEVEFEEWTDGSVSLMVPKGWSTTAYGECATKSFVVFNPNNTINQVFYFSEAGPVYTSQEQKDFDEYYMSIGGYPLFYIDSPVVVPFTSENFLNHFKELAEAYVMSTIAPGAPKMENFEIISSENSPSKILSNADEAKIIRAIFEQDGIYGEGLFYIEIYNFEYPNLGYAMTFIGVTYELGGLRTHEPMLMQVIYNYTIKDTYVSSCLHQQAQALSGALKAGQTLSESSDIIMDAWNSRNRVDDILSEKRSDAVLGYGRVYNPDTGEVYQVSTGFYDNYDLNREYYNLNNLQVLPDNDWDLWTTPTISSDEIH